MEILVAAAIIGLLAAVAIPILIRARLNANEGAVKSDLKAISSAAESFRAAQTPVAYPADLDTLSTENPPYSDNTFVNGVVKHGYTLNLVGGENTFGATAVPLTANVTGKASYCVDHTGIIRVQAVGGAYDAEEAGCGEANPPISG